MRSLFGEEGIVKTLPAVFFVSFMLIASLGQLPRSAVTRLQACICWHGTSHQEPSALASFVWNR